VKKMLIVLLIVITSAGAFAQEMKKPSAQNAININVGTTVVGLVLGGFGIGAGYERALSHAVALRLNGDYMSIKVLNESYSIFDAILTARWYPENKALEGFFVEGGGGIWGVGVPTSLNLKQSNWIFPGVQLDVGYKWNFNGFFFEPLIGYQLAFGGIEGSTFRAGGFLIGINVGFAF